MLRACSSSILAAHLVHLQPALCILLYDTLFAVTSSGIEGVGIGDSTASELFPWQQVVNSVATGISSLHQQRIDLVASYYEI